MKKNKKILIVEDDKEIVFVYKEMIKSVYDLIIVGNTKDAFKKLENNKIDLMILDIVLPKESGDIFFEKLKKIPKYKKLKTIVVTVLGDVCDFFEKIDPDVVCMTKPFTKQRLISNIEELLNKKLKK